MESWWGPEGEHHSHFQHNKQITDTSGCVNYSLPAQTTAAIPSLSGKMEVSQILNWIIASTSRWANNWAMKSQSPVTWNPSLTHTQTYSRLQTKGRKKGQKRGELKQTLVMSERAHSHTESSTCLSILLPHYKGIADVPFEGWNGLSKLTGSRQGGQGEAGLCLQPDTQPSVWTRTSCCPANPASLCGWWCFLWTWGASPGRARWFSPAEGPWAQSLS